MEASAKDGEGAGRGPCGLRNSELGPRPHDVLFAFKKQTVSNPKYSFMDFLSMISICVFGALFENENMFRMVMGINRV